jgi:hypothetical protein
MRRLSRASVIAVAAVLGCGGVAAEAPLTVKLGVHRDQATQQLRAARYCHTTDGLPQKLETYPRCQRAGAEWSESWVTARYEGDLLVELRRWERFTDEERAVERWNQLVGERMKLSPDAPDAAAALRTSGGLEPGTRSLKAFRVDADTIVGVYLLTPTPPQDAHVLELIVRAPN